MCRLQQSSEDARPASQKPTDVVIGNTALGNLPGAGSMAAQQMPASSSSAAAQSPVHSSSAPSARDSAKQHLQITPSEIPSMGQSGGSPQLPSAEQLWAGAWQAFEAPEEASATSAPRSVSNRPDSAVPDSATPQNSFPSLAARLFRGGSRPSGSRVVREGPVGPDQDAWAKPQRALQGINPQARIRLLACALAALEKQISALPDALSM
jgi:hypothetical protein